MACSSSTRGGTFPGPDRLPKKVIELVIIATEAPRDGLPCRTAVGAMKERRETTACRCRATRTSDWRCEVLSDSVSITDPIDAYRDPERLSKHCVGEDAVGVEQTMGPSRS